MTYGRQIGTHPQGTNVPQRSTFGVFHLCPLSLKLPEMILLVSIFLGNACSYINFLTYSVWTNCSDLFEEGSFFKVVYASYPSMFLTPNSGLVFVFWFFMPKGISF